VDEVKKLQTEASPLSGLLVKMRRVIFNMLSSGTEIQKFYAFAVESVDSVLSDATFHSLPSLKYKVIQICVAVFPLLQPLDLIVQLNLLMILITNFFCW
jgi:hypothetical protein